MLPLSEFFGDYVVQRSKIINKLIWSLATLSCLFPVVAIAEVLTESSNNPKATVEVEVEEDPAEIFARAEEAMRRMDVKESVLALKKAAEMNYLPAQVFLGEYYDYSEYNEDAVGWFMTAAFQGSVTGAFGLAKMYASGEGIQQSNEKALFWFRFAAERNHFAAAQIMHSTYKQGLFGQQIDLEQAKYWEEKLPALQAFERKELEAQRKLAEERIAKAKEKQKAIQKELKEKLLRQKALESESGPKDSQANKASTPSSETQ